MDNDRFVVTELGVVERLPLDEPLAGVGAVDEVLDPLKIGIRVVREAGIYLLDGTVCEIEGVGFVEIGEMTGLGDDH